VRRHWGKTSLGLAVTSLALWWVLRDESPAEIWEAIHRGNLGLLAAAVLVATVGYLVRAMRWKVLLAPVKGDTTLRSRFASVSIGFMANNLLPARVGEFARAYAISRMEPISAGAALGSLVVERFMDGVVLLLLLAVPVLTPGFPATSALSTGLGAAVLRGGLLAVSVVLAALVLMAVWPRAFVRSAERVARRLPRSVGRPLVGALEALLDAVAVLRAPRLLALGLAWTVFFWLFHGLSFWLGMKAFGIDTGLVSAFFTEAVVGFGVAIPSAPGFFGTFHASAQFALASVYGVDAARALAFAFGYHFGSWIPITLIGLGYAWKLGLTVGDVRDSEERVERVVEGEHGVALEAPVEAPAGRA
jgi:uncharacterized protein (TIRG00374 family)